MFTVPSEMVAVVAAFAPVFVQERVFVNAQTLLWGTILAQGPRTVAAALRAVGLAQKTNFTKYHRLLNAARWSALVAARILLRVVVTAFVPSEATVVVAIDDFIERRHSGHLFGLGAYRDPVRSSHKHQVTCFGLRWLVACVCVCIPGASRAWALPVFSKLVRPPEVKSRNAASSKKAKRTSRKAASTPGKAKAKARKATPRRRPRIKRASLRSRRVSTAQRPFARTEAQRQAHKPSHPRRHKTTIDLAAQMLSLLSRWLPARKVVAVLDGAFFSYKLLRHAVRVGVGVVVRGRWSMVLYQEPGPRPEGARGPEPSRGARIGTLRQIAQDPATTWEAVEIDWYGGQRKRLEVATGTGMWSNDNQTAIRVRYVMTRDLEPDPKKRLREEVFVTTEVEAAAEQILQWYITRWSEEVTFEESRRHLGIETGRGWRRLTLERSTPALLGIFSIVTLLAVRLSGGKVPIQKAAWYPKREVTFSDCLAYVRRELWRGRYLQAMGQGAGEGEFSATELEKLLDALSLSP